MIAQYLNYYPKYELLDMALSMSNKNKLCLFIDLKGCFQSLYLEWAVKQILQESKLSYKIDCSPFYSVLYFLSFHNLYAKKRNIEIKYFFFLESGESDYHKNIYKDYKKNRRQQKFFDLDEYDRDLYFKILRKNYEVMDKIINKIPKCYFIYLRNLEADFVSYFILNKVMKEDLKDYCNIIYSTDKDMIQCLKEYNYFQYVRTVKTKKLLHRANALEYFLKKEIKNADIYFDLFCLILAILGDSSDGIPGIVKGVGPATILKNLDVLKEHFTPMDEVFNKIVLGKKILDGTPRTNNKLLLNLYENQENLIRNLKLISFELLSDYFLNNYKINVLKKLEKVKEILYKQEKIKNWKVLYLSLNNFVPISTNIEESVVQNLFI